MKRAKLLLFSSLMLFLFRARCEFVKRVKLLQALNDQMVNQVASALVEESFTEGQYIITQVRGRGSGRRGTSRLPFTRTLILPCPDPDPYQLFP